MITEFFGGLLSRFSLYIMAALLLIAVAAGGYAWLQSARLDGAQQRAERMQGERDAAIGANSELVKQAEQATAAQRQLQIVLETLRVGYERRLHALHEITDDGCLDRPLPPGVLRLLTGRDPGASDAARTGGP